MKSARVGGNNGNKIGGSLCRKDSNEEDNVELDAEKDVEVEVLQVEILLQVGVLQVEVLEAGCIFGFVVLFFAFVVLLLFMEVQRE